MTRQLRLVDPKHIASEMEDDLCVVRHLARVIFALGHGDAVLIYIELPFRLRWACPRQMESATRMLAACAAMFLRNSNRFRDPGTVYNVERIQIC
jgi:hypothetical protein